MTENTGRPDSERSLAGIDIVVNNASAIDLSNTAELPMKKYDLMQDINTRGSFLLAQTALPWLEKSAARSRTRETLERDLFLDG
ncbi:hypothetical protein GCM10009670_21020 [Citricoccus alkalitolerans]